MRRAYLAFVGLLLVLTACRPSVLAPFRPSAIVKIALIAPFEGRFAAVGYEAFPAMRIALREQATAGGIRGFHVEFVAFNDNADPIQAAQAARSAAVDPLVLAVIGHYRLDTTLAALETYEKAGLPIVAPTVPSDLLPAHRLLFRMGPRSTRLRAPESCRLNEEVLRTVLAVVPDLQTPNASRLFGAQLAGACFWTDAPFPRDRPAAQQALSNFRDVSGGAEPGPRSISAYDATRLILKAVEADIATHGAPTRAGVAEALRRITYTGLLGTIQFDAKGQWSGAPVWLYRFDQSGTLVSGE
ncbi:MAG: ABC transporter substrate-binding protein [Anaerolineae bacterium]|nr:ABC transporter substrate-binding protein [Thermoflexales bacterium]MDW8407586.1 ABC transporter substrate-binding protein [Anaerolineae bacterium]